MESNADMTRAYIIAFCGLIAIGLAGCTKDNDVESTGRRALEGTVNTRIGPLKFINGYPSNETVDRLYEELDFQRAAQAYLWALPMMNCVAMRDGSAKTWKPGDFELTE